MSLSDVRTSLRLSSARQTKLKQLKRAWGMPSNDETVGFLIEIADADKMRELAARHVAKIRVLEERERQKREQLEKVMANLTPEQIEKLISGEAQVN